MVTSIHSRHLKNNIQLETRKQGGSWQKIQNQRKRKRNQVSEEKSLRKKNKKFFENEIVDAPFETNINTVVEKHLIRISHADVVVN